MNKEPIGYKFDTSINKPVLMKRCDNYYYAYPSITGWVFYRSRYLGERDKEIIDIDFDDWSHKVIDVLINESKILGKENINLKQDINEIKELVEELSDNTDDTICYDIDKDTKEEILQIVDKVIGDEEK